MSTLRHVVDHLRTLLGAETACASDRELLQHFAARRDEAAFAALLQRHGPLVWGVCRRVLAQREDAEDAFQATFLVLARQAASTRWRESIRSWLYETAFKVAQQSRRRALRRHNPGLASEPVCAAEEPGWREVGAILDEELSRLPVAYREVVLLCCLEGKTRDEAAEALGCSLGRVKGLLERGRELLRQRLARRGVALSAVLVGGLGLGGALRATPALLLTATARAGVQFAAGQTSAVPAAVVALATEALRPVTLSTFKTALAAVVLGAVGVAAVSLPRHVPGNDPIVARVDHPTDQQPSNEEMDAMNQWVLSLGVISALTLAASADEGKPKEKGDEAAQVRGVVSAIDARKRTITIAIRRDGDAEARQESHEIARDAEIVIGEGRPTKLDEIKAGQQVQLKLGADGKTVVHVRVLPARRPPMIRGTIKEIDAGKGTLIVSVPRDGGRVTEETVTVGKDAQVSLQKRPAKLTDLKAGLRVIVELTPDQKGVVQVQASVADGEGAKDPPREGDRPRGNEVVIKAMDPARGTITVLVVMGERSTEKSYSLAKDVKLLIDGKAAKSGEIQVGDAVTLTLSADGKTVTEIKGRARKGD